MQFHFHANQSHFHMKGFALRFALKQRYKGTRKWPKQSDSPCYIWNCSLQLVSWHLLSSQDFCIQSLLWSFYYWLCKWGNKNSRFSPVMWSKLKIITVQWITSRIWDTIDDWYINNIAKNQVFAVFHSRVICKSVSPKFRELCMETPCLCPSEGHKYGGRKVTETSVTEFCFWNEKLSL